MCFLLFLIQLKPGNENAVPQIKEKQAYPSIYLVSSPNVDGITGKYFYDSHVIPTAPQATDRVVARKLWDVSAEIVHLADGLPAKT
jgi:hypothetical protein